MAEVVRYTCTKNYKNFKDNLIEIHLSYIQEFYHILQVLDWGLVVIVYKLKNGTKIEERIRKTSNHATMEDNTRKGTCSQ
jgi:hypothetical protein